MLCVVSRPRTCPGEYAIVELVTERRTAADTPVIGVTGYADRRESPPQTPTFSLARSYAWAVLSSRGAPVILPPHLERPALRAVFDRLDGLLLSGGGDVAPSFYGEEDGGALGRVDERRDRTELALARWALAGEMPLLAVCRGIQILNVAAHGTLVQDILTELPDALDHRSVEGRPPYEIAHTVNVTAGSLLASLVGAGALDVNSAHHQAVKDVGTDLVVTARAPDGVIEGLEAPHLPFCLGVQWHPEAMVGDCPAMRRLFEGFISAAR